MRFPTPLILFAIAANVSAAPSDSYCVKIGKMTESTAKVREGGAPESMLLSFNAKTFAVDSSKPKVEQDRDAENKKIADNMVAYVYTVKLPSSQARATGYAKCRAGDFNE